MRTAIFVLLAACIACNGTATPDDHAGDDSRVSSSTPVQVQTDFTNDTIFTVQFPTDSSSVTVTGRLQGINNPVTVLVPVTRGKQLDALLVPEDSVANVRFNQVLMPGGKADGPFGRTVQLKIGSEGLYKLIVGENLMQGEEWKGNFKLQVSVK